MFPWVGLADHPLRREIAQIPRQHPNARGGGGTVRWFCGKHQGAPRHQGSSLVCTTLAPKLVAKAFLFWVYEGNIFGNQVGRGLKEVCGGCSWGFVGEWKRLETGGWKESRFREPFVQYPREKILSPNKGYFIPRWEWLLQVTGHVCRRCWNHQPELFFQK